jgi:hypothetical protein
MFNINREFCNFSSLKDLLNTVKTTHPVQCYWGQVMGSFLRTSLEIEREGIVYRVYKFALKTIYRASEKSTNHMVSVIHVKLHAKVKS